MVKDIWVSIALLVFSPVALAVEDIKINEVLGSTTGSDVEFIELFGPPGAALDDLSIVIVESDVGESNGVIDQQLSLPGGSAIGVNGFYLIGNDLVTLAYGVTPNLSIPGNFIENSSYTIALVETGSISGSAVTGSETVLDAVGVSDGGEGDAFFFGAPVVGPDGSFLPAGARRISDGVDTDTSADWLFGDFDIGPDNTPTAGIADDLAPTVTTTSPAEGSTDVPVSSIISLEFSESVDVAPEAIRVECPIGTTVASNSAAGAVTSIEIAPAGDLPASTECRTVIDPDGVTDNDGGEDTLFGTNVFNFSTGNAASVTPIHAIQGAGDTAAAGTFTVEAIVVGAYQSQGSGQLRGFFLQEEDADTDADPATSEGIFVFCSSCPTPVAVGDLVSVTGASTEFFGLSQLTATSADSVTVLSSGNALPTPASIDLPAPSALGGDLAAATAAINGYYEAFESMLVSFADTLTVSEYFELGRFGQVILTEGPRPRQFTDQNAPSEAGLIAHQIDLARRRVILDDTNNLQNGPVASPNSAYFHPTPGLSTTNFFRGGDTINNLSGVLHWSFAGQSGTDAWRIRPVTEAFDYAFTEANPRAASPVVSASLTVASFNVLNYFLSVDETSSNSSGSCGASATLDCRGADSDQELDRQREKLTQALLQMDSDVVGLIEIENTPGVKPAQQIAADLNAVLGAGTYAFVDTGVIGTDAIRVGLIYKPAKVETLGSFAILDSTVDPNFVDTRNRPALAQTFAEVATGASFTVAVNHFKSKGSGCGPGDDDTSTGQGNCNGTRTAAATALADWLAGDPTGSGDPDVLIIGDLNAYAKEDPIAALRSAEFTDLLGTFGGAGAYSYLFGGQLGYLDHALSNASLTPQVAGVAAWNINADEIPLFDYNDDLRDAGEASFEEKSDSLPLYAPDPYRTSDHDPVIVGLNLNAEPIAIPGDINGDGIVDLADLNLVTAARNATASDADDPRDLDGDGRITALDARKLVLLCTLPRCRTP